MGWGSEGEGKGERGTALMHAAATHRRPSSTTTAPTRPECADRGRLEQRDADARRLTPTKEQRCRPNYTWSAGARKIVAVGRQRARRLSAPASPRKAQHLVPQICADGHPSSTRQLLLRFPFTTTALHHQMRHHLRATPPENGGTPSHARAFYWTTRQRQRDRERASRAPPSLASLVSSSQNTRLPPLAP